MNKILMNKFFTHALALLVGLGIGYFSWNTNSTSKKKSKIAQNSTEAKKPNTTAPAPIAPPKDSLTIKGGDVEMEKPSATSTNVAVNSKALCGGNAMDLKTHLTSFSENIEAQKIMYKSVDLSDCSGMFLRVMQSMEGICPDYIYPNENEHRDTRKLAKWFYDNNNLQLTENVLDYDHLIKPGAVIFYGHQGKRYNNPTIEMLTAEDGIEHVGVVTEVTKKDDIVTKYSLFHGRSTGNIAARTNYHNRKDKHKKDKEGNPIYYPPFGNGDQFVVAIGFVTTPKPGI